MFTSIICLSDSDTLSQNERIQSLWCPLIRTSRLGLYKAEAMPAPDFSYDEKKCK